MKNWDGCCPHGSDTLCGKSLQGLWSSWLFPQGFSSSIWHPQGEYPINPSMFVQRRIGSFDCQWTRGLLESHINTLPTFSLFWIFTDAATDGGLSPLNGSKKVWCWHKMQIIDSCLEFKTDRSQGEEPYGAEIFKLPPHSKIPMSLVLTSRRLPTTH